MAKRLKTQVPLIVENHPADYDGYSFITLLQYRGQHILTIVDSADDSTIKAYVLDLCGPEHVSEELVIAIADQWHTSGEGKYPLSFEFSKLQISGEMSKIMRTFSTDFVTRVIGPLPSFPMQNTNKIKRRRKKDVGDIAIRQNVVKLYQS